MLQRGGRAAGSRAGHARIDHRAGVEEACRADTFLVRELEALTPRDAAIAGEEAVELGELARAGLPVPPALAVTTAAYARSMEAGGVRRALSELYDLALRSTDRTVPAELGAELAGLIRAAGVCDEVAVAVRSAYAGLGIEDMGAVRAVVRPSSVREGPALDDHRPAGGPQIVRGAPAVLDAIVECWASVFGPGVPIRRARVAGRNQPATAVLVQAAATRADSAGLAVTSGPSAVPPVVLVETRMGGRRSGEVDAPAARMLTDAETARVAQLALRAEWCTGRAQTVEWVLDDGHLHLVGVRPCRIRRAFTTIDPLSQPAEVARQE